MIDYSHPLLQILRRFGQRLGILRPIVRLFRRIFKPSYENSFDQQMMAQVSQNDIVWDIGANVGFFTTKFAEKVGEDGQVYAFEPANNSFLSLVENCKACKNVFGKNMALSDKSGYLYFRESEIANDPTNSLVDENHPNSVKVQVVTGDELIETNTIPLPNIVKIDVEGYEIDVIQGMKNMLSIRDRGVRGIFIEVHFFELNKRGLSTAVSNIVDILEQLGFSLKWTDPSHLIGCR